MSRAAVPFPPHRGGLPARICQHMGIAADSNPFRFFVDSIRWLILPALLYNTRMMISILFGEYPEIHEVPDLLAVSPSAELRQADRFPAFRRN